MDSEFSEEDASSTEAPPPNVKRGRPVGKTDEKPRFRRTAQEISEDKIKIAQMKLDALKEAEGARLANKKSTRRPPQTKATIEESALPPAPKPVVRQEEPKRNPNGSRRHALYDSWFPGSPRTKHY